MKKLVTLLLAAGLVFAASAPSQAQSVDLKVRGAFQFTGGFFGNWLIPGSNPGPGAAVVPGALAAPASFQSSADFRHNRQLAAGTEIKEQHDFFSQRLWLGLDLAASENLQGTLELWAGFMTWGFAGADNNSANSRNQSPWQGGGAINGRPGTLAIRAAYLDWMIPSTTAKVRMGYQNWGTPNMTGLALSPFFRDDFGTGIQVTVPFTQQVSATLGWLRASSDDRRNAYNVGSDKDAIDFFSLTVPIKLDGINITPMLVYGVFGEDTVGTGAVPMMGNYRSPYNLTTHPTTGNPISQGATFYHLSFSGNLTKFNPFTFAWDLEYANYNGKGVSQNDRSGWFAALSGAYRLDNNWGVPTLKLWYGSGDDRRASNGSERMPTTSPASHVNAGMSPLLDDGHRYGILRGLNANLAGTYGASLQWNSVSFLQDLSHSIRLSYVRGNNSSSRFNNTLGTTAGLGTGPVGQANVPGYMTNKDSLWMLHLENSYVIYKGLTAYLDLFYLMENFSGSVFNRLVNTPAGIRAAHYSNAYGINTALSWNF